VEGWACVDKALYEGSTRRTGHNMAGAMTEPFLQGGGTMGEAIRSFDWSATALGRMETWPASLKTALGLMLMSRFPQALIWGPQLITFFNDAFRPILGNKPFALGQPFSEVWLEAWNTIGPIADKALAGEATFIEDFPLSVNRNGYMEQAYFTFCYSPLRDDTGKVAGFVDTVIETTPKVEAERTLKLLNAELAHRLQNTLASVLAIASHTFRSSSSLESGQEAFANRIAALGRAHALLGQSTWHPVSIQDLVEEALAPFRTARTSASASGPEVKLSARHTLALTLALNELATNALKYGALSAPGGSVSIRWAAGRPASADLFRFAWEETGGPTVREPSKRGFGSRLIEMTLADDFRGEVSLQFLPGGLRCEFTTEMSNLT
jgi:two-component sensor histidine kinase